MLEILTEMRNDQRPAAEDDDLDCEAAKATFALAALAVSLCAVLWWLVGTFCPYLIDLMK